MYEAIAIGGSWGGMTAAVTVLQDLPSTYGLAVILILHRLRGQKSELHTILDNKISLKVKEIDEKEEIRKGIVYLAPADYHVLVEKNKTFSLDTSELVHFTRPSIDVTFESASEVFTDKLIGIILSGNNKDGTMGLLKVAEMGGLTIVQDPSEAEANPMPLSAMEGVKTARVLTLKEISEFLKSIL